MNKQLQNYARNELKAGLAQLTEAHQLLFKRMYAGGQTDLSIDDVVDMMPPKKLDMAMQQVKRSIDRSKTD